MKKHGFVKGTILGALVGAVAGVLLAPKSGKETQADLKRKVKETYSDVAGRLQQLSDDVTGQVDHLKEVAKDVSAEAKDESKGLIKRAEVIKQDLRISATNLTKEGDKTKNVATENVKALLDEGAEVLKELERVTKKLASSTKEKLAEDKSSKA